VTLRCLGFLAYDGSASGVGVGRTWTRNGGDAIKRLLLLLATALVAAPRILAGEAPGHDEEKIAQAKILFEDYVRLERAFDPAVADLYADSALIQNRRAYPTGEVRSLTMPAPLYKEVLREVMPLAKARGDTSTYSQVTYAVDADQVRIAATRYSELKKYSSPLSLLVGPAENGKWLIYEERSESKP